MKTFSQFSEDDAHTIKLQDWFCESVSEEEIATKYKFLIEAQQIDEVSVDDNRAIMGVMILVSSCVIKLLNEGIPTRFIFGLLNLGMTHALGRCSFNTEGVESPSGDEKQDLEQYLRSYIQDELELERYWSESYSLRA